MKGHGGGGSRSGRTDAPGIGWLRLAGRSTSPLRVMSCEVLPAASTLAARQPLQPLCRMMKGGYALTSSLRNLGRRIFVVFCSAPGWAASIRAVLLMLVC